MSLFHVVIHYACVIDFIFVEIATCNCFFVNTDSTGELSYKICMYLLLPGPINSQTGTGFFLSIHIRACMVTLRTIVIIQIFWDSNVL